MERKIQLRYQDPTELNQLCDTIKADFEKVLTLDCRSDMAKLTSCQLESYYPDTEGISAHERIIDDLIVCDIMFEASWRKFYMISNLPKTEEWITLVSPHQLTEKADTVVNIVTHLLSFEAFLCIVQGLAPDVALFITKTGRGRQFKVENVKDRKADVRKGDDMRTHVICHGCGVKGHIKAKCRSKHKWASYEKFTSDANLTSTALTSATESESLLASVIQSDHIPDTTPDSVITVNVGLANQTADYWILATGATNHITSNRLLFETFHSMAKGEHQVKTVNNSFVDAEGPGTMKFHDDRPNAKPAKIVLQYALSVPACGTNNLLSIIQIMRQGVSFHFKLDGPPVILQSDLVNKAPLINPLFILRASTTSASV